MTNRKVRNLRSGEEKKHLEMLNLCYEFWGNEERYKRFYSKEAHALIAEEEGDWIGGVTAWFLRAFLKQESEMNVFISGDVYVHPDHRGRGVYGTLRRNVDRLAQERGASLGLAFTSIYNIPFSALQKYGFIEVFQPKTRILVLDPGGYFDFLVGQLKNVVLPQNMEGITVELTASVKSVNGTYKVSRVFNVENRKLRKSNASDVALNTGQRIDLRISADVETLAKTLQRFHLRERFRLLLLLADIIRGRVRLRFSARLLKVLLGL